jgi:Stress responsive A/B Barrel Domain
MTHALRAAACTALFVVAVSCQSSQKPSKEHAKPQAAVTHVVLVWLKTPGDEAARRRIIETSRTFRTIPGVVSVRSGTALPSTRPVVDWSYDVGLVMTFEDEAALRAYDGHPTHKKAVEEVLRPLAGKIVVYDFADGGSAR